MQLRNIWLSVWTTSWSYRRRTEMSTFGWFWFHFCPSSVTFLPLSLQMSIWKHRWASLHTMPQTFMCIQYINRVLQLLCRLLLNINSPMEMLWCGQLLVVEGNGKQRKIESWSLFSILNLSLAREGEHLCHTRVVHDSERSHDQDLYNEAMDLCKCVPLLGEEEVESQHCAEDNLYSGTKLDTG